MSVTYTARALADLDDIEDDLSRSGLRAVAAFQSRLQRTVGPLEQFPLMAPAYEPEDPRYPGMRVSPVRRAESFAVFYQPTADGITVLRVLHASRNIAAIFTPPPDPNPPPPSGS